MGRTLPSITQTFLMEQEAFTRFRRALRRSDQIALDDLFVSAQKHLAAAAYAAHALPLETFMLSMLLEEHKEVQRLRRQMDEITGQLPAGEDRMLLVEETPAAEFVEDNPALDRLGQRTIPPAGSTQNPAAEFIEAPVAELTEDKPALDRLGQRIIPPVGSTQNPVAEFVEAPVTESTEDNSALDRLGQRTIPPAGSTQNPAAEFIEAPAAEFGKDNPALDRLGQRTSTLTDESEVIDVDPGLS